MENDRPNSFRRTRLGPMVSTLVENSSSYERNAMLDDGLCHSSVELVQAKQEGAVPALHAKWQQEGHVSDLTADERVELSRAGFRVHRDGEGYWAWWRERKYSHFWLALTREGWVMTKAPSIRGVRWKLIGSLTRPTIPLFENYTVTPESIIRESLAASMMIVTQEVPAKILEGQFFQVVKELCDDAIQTLNRDRETLDTLLSQVPVLNAAKETEYVQFQLPRGGYSGGGGNRSGGGGLQG